MPIASLGGRSLQMLATSERRAILRNAGLDGSGWIVEGLTQPCLLQVLYEADKRQAQEGVQ